ncbi:Ig-like domain-containing protein [uncultured Muribaculum sp.]|uniref:Ig-like domain-containing protein n=1 Tax=uncultured Muribaculum sp. TaxID=1918613 RepID=UPI0025993A8C|nr:Ig-like domain-containing protein [uncultured Muribaculum sp.]
MNKYIKNASVGFMILIAMIMNLQANAINLWVGQSYTWDFSGSIMGSTYNMNVTTNGGYLSVTGSGFYRTITPTQYFSGTATVTAEWDYTLYYGDTKRHQRISVTISCNENPVSISPTNITLSPGQTYQLSYRHKYDNQYVSAANAYFSGGNSHFTVSSSGLITAKSPGSGYATVYSKVSSATNAPSCYVTVKSVDPTGATTGNYSVLADQSTDLKVNVSPSNATVKSTQWYIKSGSDIVSISGSRLTGLKPGSATIYCMLNGSIRSNDATVTVTEPSLTVSTENPLDGSTNVSVFTNPSVTFSHQISKGAGFNSIRLTANGDNVEGTTEISNNIVRFLPSKPLQALTKYTLSIPKSAVCNKWGSSAQTDITSTFTTADLEEISLEFTPSPGSYITSNETVKIIANPEDSKIHYTIDGSNPTLNSPQYINPIEISSDITIKAFAMREGYKDSDIAIGNFLKSQSEIVEYYPSDISPLFNYGYVNPFLRLSGTVVKSNNFRRISLKKSTGEDVDGNTYLANHIIVFVPDKPLENTTTYTLDIPYDAVKTANGEVFKGFSWTFSTPNMPVQVGIQGDETIYMLLENGQLMSRGMQLKSSKVSGEITFEDWDNLQNYKSEVNLISCGYTHNAILDKRNSPILKGLNYCGELGDNNPTFGSTPKLVKAGYQTSAIICEDNTLWMCGRNDFYQIIGNEGTHSAKFIKVADNILDVALGNGYTLYVDTNNILWAIGRNHLGQLGDGSTIDRTTPVKIMDGVESVFTSPSGYFSACITLNHDLHIWGDNSFSQLGHSDLENNSIPKVILSDVTKASLGGWHGFALTSDNKLYGWGNNAHGQLPGELFNAVSPKLVAENVLDMDAGPKTSLVLYISGKVSGWGYKTHSNLGSGYGNASNFIVNLGRTYDVLQGASLIYNFH